MESPQIKAQPAALPKRGTRSRNGSSIAGGGSLRRPRAKVRRGVDSAVEPRPRPPRPEGPARFGRSSPACPQVVDRVYERRLPGGRGYRRAVLQRAVVRQLPNRRGSAGVNSAGNSKTSSSTGCISFRRRIRERSSAGSPLEGGVGAGSWPAGRRCRRSSGSPMSCNIGHGNVAVDPRKGRGGGADRMGDRDRVVEEPVAIRLVVVLGSRRVAEPGPHG